MLENFVRPIAISGLGGSGKSTVAAILSEKLGLKKMSGGDFMRQCAKKIGISADNGDFQKYRESNPSIDYELDRMQFESLREGNVILESRFSSIYHPYTCKLVPREFYDRIGIDSRFVLPCGEVMTVFLYCEDHERFRRIRERRKNSGIEGDVEKEEKQRQDADQILYKKLYNLNPFEFKYSEYVTDCTKRDPNDVASWIIDRYYSHQPRKKRK